MTRGQTLGEAFDHFLMLNPHPDEERFIRCRMGEIGEYEREIYWMRADQARLEALAENSAGERRLALDVEINVMRPFVRQFEEGRLIARPRRQTWSICAGDRAIHVERFACLQFPAFFAPRISPWRKCIRRRAYH
jgi:hypothetical protein